VLTVNRLVPHSVLDKVRLATVGFAFLGLLPHLFLANPAVPGPWAPHLTAADLMRCADIAMYSAKARGKSRVEHFIEGGHDGIARTRQLEEHLPHAIERGEITLSYQPLVDLATGECRGVEALARWQHGALGPVPPAVFIPIATRTGQILALGRHVLHTACQQVTAWHGAPGGDRLSLSINVAARQLYDPGFVATVQEALAGAGLAADRLIIEITEDEPVDAGRAGATLASLAGLGVRIAIDDFGIGHAFIEALRSFPVHQIKTDRSLLANQSPVDTALFEAAARTGVALALEVVAEGVETEEQAEKARRAGMHTAQGYLFARPMPADEVPRWLALRATALR
jgi:EAL domain-containing protein (putative c-di-GMP-specific phosphodiesterase class I)